MRALQQATRELLPARVSDKIIQAANEGDVGVHSGKVKLPCEAYAVNTGSTPLSMYTAPMWAMGFPDCFPYGDGVFGLPRAEPLTFQQCADMHLIREELSYSVTRESMIAAKRWFAQDAPSSRDVPDSKRSFQEMRRAMDQEETQLFRKLAEEEACTCVQCSAARQAFEPPMQRRWGQNRDLLCCDYDSWRRMEQIRRAKAHVKRSGYHEKLEKICSATAEQIETAMRFVGENGSIRDVLRSPESDPGLKEALAELMVFTTEVVGTDGARAKLRHEQNGYGLAFGHAGGFLTPNMSDVRSPLLVVLHGGGVDERFEVNLLDECPTMPSARDMLQIVAQDPVAQACDVIIDNTLCVTEWSKQIQTKDIVYTGSFLHIINAAVLRACPRHWSFRRPSTSQWSG